MKTVMQLLSAIKTYILPIKFYRTELPGIPLSNGTGWHDGGLCLFHEDHHAGSFYVNLQTGAFHCFSCEAKGGDIIAFIQLRDNLSFTEAVQKLADAWGL